MGLKEYIAKKQQEKSAPKYNIHSIEYVYTKDGQFFAPFVFNIAETKIKDIKTEKIVCLKDGKNSRNSTKQALSELFSVDIDDIEYLTLLDLVYHYTYGARIPGKIFKKVRAEIFDAPHDRKDIIKHGSIHKIVANAYDLEPLTKQLSKNFQTQYRTKIERDKVLQDVNENIKF